MIIGRIIQLILKFSCSNYHVQVCNVGTIKVTHGQQVSRGRLQRYSYYILSACKENHPDLWHRKKHIGYPVLALVVEYYLDLKQVKSVSREKLLFVVLKFGFLDIVSELRKLRLLRICQDKWDGHLQAYISCKQKISVSITCNLLSVKYL